MIHGDLTQDEIDRILEGPGDPYYKVRLRKFGFDWTAAGVSVPSGAVDIAVFGATIRVISRGTDHIDVWDWTPGGLSNSSSVASGFAPGALCVSRSGGKIFYSVMNEVYSQDDVVNPIATLVSSGGVRYIAAPDNFTVYYGVSDYGMTHFGTLTYSEDLEMWLDTPSGIYWPFAITGFHSAKARDGDVVIVSGTYTPYRAARAIGTDVSFQLRTRSGVVSFQVNNGHWSDHTEVQIADHYYNQAITLSGGFSAGTADNPMAGIIYGFTSYGATTLAYSLTSSGIFWELPTNISPSTTGVPFIAILGENVYFMVAGEEILSTKSSLRFQRPLPEDSGRDLDISTLIKGGSFSVRMKAGVKLTGFLSSTVRTFLEDKEAMLLELSLGYKYPDGNVRTIVFTGEVDEASWDKVVQSGGEQEFSVSAKDVLAFTERTKSPYAYEYPAVVGGFDNYIDESNTGYGGLSKTAPQIKSYKTPLDTDVTHNYYLTPSNQDGEWHVAFSTFVPNALNGFISAEFQIDSPEELVGLVYRGVSGFYLTELVYYPEDQEIVLRIRDGADLEGNAVYQTIHTITAVAPMLDFELMVHYRYGVHKIFVRGIGEEVPVHIDTVYSNLGMQEGYSGTICKPLNIPLWTPGPDLPIWDFPPYVPPEVPEEESWHSWWAVGTTSNGFYFTDNMPQPNERPRQPKWVAMNEGLPDPIPTFKEFWCIDGWRHFMLALTDSGDIWRRNGPYGSWSLSLDHNTLPPLEHDGTSPKIAWVTSEGETCYAHYAGGIGSGNGYVVLRSTDYGASWEGYGGLNRNFNYGLGQLIIANGGLFLSGCASALSGSTFWYAQCWLNRFVCDCGSPTCTPYCEEIYNKHRELYCDCHGQQWESWGFFSSWNSYMKWDGTNLKFIGGNIMTHIGGPGQIVMMEPPSGGCPYKPERTLLYTNLYGGSRPDDWWFDSADWNHQIWIGDYIRETFDAWGSYVATNTTMTGFGPGVRCMQSQPWYILGKVSGSSYPLYSYVAGAFSPINVSGENCLTAPYLESIPAGSHLCLMGLWAL